MKRRDFVKLSGIAASAIMIEPALQSCSDNMNMMNMNMGSNAVAVIEGAFTSSLGFPNVVSNNFSITAKANTSTILNNQSSSVLGYGNSILGPTIKVSSPMTVAPLFQNQLSEETNVHWHGLLLTANMDGHPKNVVQSGSSFNFNLPINRHNLEHEDDGMMLNYEIV